MGEQLSGAFLGHNVAYCKLKTNGSDSSNFKIKNIEETKCQASRHSMWIELMEMGIKTGRLLKVRHQKRQSPSQRGEV